MKNNKTIKIFGIFLVIALLIYIAITFFIPGKGTNVDIDTNKQKINLYFINPSTNKLEIEERYIEKRDDIAMASDVVALLREGPKNKKLSKTLLDAVEILPGGTIVSNTKTLVIECSPSYNDMSPVEEQFFRTALVYTMTDLDFIDQVHIYVEGKELVTSNGKAIGDDGILSRKNVLINKVISPYVEERVTVKLYFADKQSKGLVLEERTIPVDPNVFLGEYVVKELIKGPSNPNLLPTVPPETKILTVNVDEYICYLNLSKEFISKHTGGTTAEKLTVYSIVNSLTEIAKVSKVQFSVESKTVDDFKGSIDLSKQFDPDPTLILEPE